MPTRIGNVTGVAAAAAQPFFPASEKDAQLIQAVLSRSLPRKQYLYAIFRTTHVDRWSGF